MGSLFKSQSQSVSDPGAAEAWNIAKPTQTFANEQAVNLVGNILNNPAYSGQRVAELNPFQAASATNLGTFANNTGGLSYNLMNTGLSPLEQSAAVGTNAADIYNRASIDPTQGIINAAGQYADNPYVSGMIDAAGRDTVRQLTEQALPSLARGVAGTGNINSSRAGVESAILQRGAQDRLADISSNIRGQFFGTGLGMAQNQYNQNLSNMLSANSGLMNAGNYGAGLINAGQGFAGNTFNLGQSAGGVFQNQNQNVLNADMARFNETYQNPLSALQALSGIGANTQARTSAGVTTNPSIMSQIAAVGQAGAQAYRASDIRMKENITKIGALPSGLGLYEFDYKPEFKDVAGHGRFIGVMAQEAMEQFPEAVAMMDNGYYAVDYSKVN